MDSLTFTTEITKALVWPLVCLYVLHIAKPIVLSITPKLKSIKISELELEIEQASSNDFITNKAKLNQNIGDIAKLNLRLMKAELCIQSPQDYIVNKYNDTRDKIKEILFKNKIEIKNQNSLGELISLVENKLDLDKAAIRQAKALELMKLNFHLLKNEDITPKLISEIYNLTLNLDFLIEEHLTKN